MKFSKKDTLLATLIMSAICQPVWAAEADLTQPRPGDAFNKDATLRQTPTEQKKESPIENAAKPQEQKQSGEAASVKFLLTKLNVDKSEILTDKEIRTIAAKYEGHEVSLADVNAAVQEINQLYVKKQNVLARAVLVSQKVENGTVNIKLVESHLGKYRVEGAKHTSDRYFMQRMKLKEGQLLKLDQLEQDVIRFNRTNGTQMRVVLVKGERAGTTDVVLKAAEEPKQQGVLFTDNLGNEKTGQYRTGAIWTVNSLNGGGDCLTINTIKAKSTTGGGISYQAPIDYMGTQLGISYNKNQNSMGFESLDIKGKSSDFSVSINHPFEATLDSKRVVYGEIHKKTSDINVDVGDRGETVKSAVVGVAEQKDYNNGMRYQRLELTKGYGYTSGEFVGQNREIFTKLNYSYTSHFVAGKKGSFLVRASAQWNLRDDNRYLPSTERFSLGGFSTVRGYSEGDLTGDSGYFISGEYHFPLRKKIEGVIFLDHGGAFAYDSSRGVTPNTRDNYMTGAGVGIVSNINKNTSLQVFWGTPLNFVINKGKYAKGGHLHFYLQHRL